MKILFIFTGGTIGSTLIGNTVSTDKTKSFGIIKAYSDLFGIDFDYDATEPYAQLSENNTGDNLRDLCLCVRKNLDGYEGIIVTHGTDTLQFSSSAVGYAVGNRSIPVCFVSANHPIENPLSNGLYNLHGAIKFIQNKSGKGAFVVYKNPDSESVGVFRATRLVASKAFSDEVDCIFGQKYGEFDKDFNYLKNDTYFEDEDRIAPIPINGLRQKSEKILWISPYPGMTYPEISETVEYILLNAFHSGTINTKSEEAREFFEKAKEKNIRVYITGVTDGPSYSSANAFNDFNIKPIKNISPVSAYVKLWLLIDAKFDPDLYLQKSLGGDLAIK